MKVGIYAGEFPSTTFVNSLVSGLCTRGFEVCLFGKRATENGQWPGPEFRDFLCSKKRSHYFWPGLREKATRPAWAQSKTFHLAEYARFGPMVRQKTDIFHVQWTKHLVELLPLLPHIPGKIVLSLRGTQTNVTPWTQPQFLDQLKACFPFVAQFHAVSDHMKGVAIELGIPSEKVTVIRPAVADPLIENSLSAAKTRNLFLTVGRDHWKKGLMYAIDAFALLQKSGHKDWQYEIVGPGRFEAEKFQVADLGLTDKIRFCGEIPHSEVLNKIKNAGCLILPSVEEGLANVVLEAMALGTRVISSDCNGMPEAVVSGVNGWLFPSRSIEALAVCIQAALEQDLQQEAAMSQAARTTIRENFLASQQLDAFSQLYQKLR